MKKLLFAALAMSALSSTVMAQRMQLHEEITGENCGPCASTNPGFWALLNGGTNPTKIIHIAYMTPIPTTGWFYQRNIPVNSARRTYYGMNSAPNGKHDGLTPSVGLHPGSFTQALIDARALVPSPMSITVTNTWDASNDTVDIAVTITNTSGATVTGSLMLRAALVQNCNFFTPPGSNGETHFENIVQDMYPNATGTVLPTSWAAGETHTYNLRGKVPDYVVKGGDPFTVAWVQDDVLTGPTSKEILQAAKSAPLPGVGLDIAASNVAVGPIVCAANGSVSIPHTLTLKNEGTVAITSATLYTKFGAAGAWTSTPWSGSLAPGATATVSLTVNGTVAGPAYAVIYDSVANPNGSADISKGDNTWGNVFFIESTTPLALPYNTSFETTEQGKYYFSDENSDGGKWGVFVSGSATPIGKTGTYAAAYRNIFHPVGDVDYITLPIVANTNLSQMKFWLAHCQRDASNTDKLELIYSTTCGTSWTSAWTINGADMASVPAAPSAIHVPTTASYKEKIVNMGTIPVGAMLAIRATNGGGNMTAIDDINISNTTSVNEVATNNLNLTVFPNPAVDNATVSFNLMNATEANIQVVDGLGRVVSVISNGNLTAGTHSFSIDTKGLASGVYNVVMAAEGGTFTQRLTVAK